MKILDGKKVSGQISAELAARSSQLAAKVRLDIILVGSDFASKKYVEAKRAKAREIGMECNVNLFPEDADQSEIQEIIEELNKNSDVHGIIVQLPLPNGLNTPKILNAIESSKDVDGLTEVNLEVLKSGDNGFVPATPLGILKLLEAYEIKIKKAKVVIIGASRLVGIPLKIVLERLGAKVEIIDIDTKNKKGITQKADIVISATGKPKLVDKDWIKKGAVVVDVGFERDPKTGKIVGDVDFESVKSKASYASPVPGGVGPMTVVCLLANTVKAAMSGKQ